ncbi:MAG: hypothetical protein ACLFVN_13330 [Phycisphaeraceae bacterium]
MSADSPSVRLTSNGNYWKAVWRDSQGGRRSRGLGPKARVSERQARRKCDDLIIQLARCPGLRDCGRAPRLRHYLANYLERRDDLEPEEARAYAQAARLLADAFAPTFRLDQVTPDHAGNWRRELARELAPATVDRYVRRAWMIFRAAADDGLLDANPFDHLRATELPELVRAEVADAIEALRQGSEPPDGPRAPNIVRVGGVDHRLPALPWRLLNMLWARESAPLEEVIDEVWGDEPGKNAVGVLLSRANNTLLPRLSLRWRFSLKLERVVVTRAD